MRIPVRTLQALRSIIKPTVGFEPTASSIPRMRSGHLSYIGESLAPDSSVATASGIERDVVDIALLPPRLSPPTREVEQARVRVRGFEPPTTRIQTEDSTRLSYTLRRKAIPTIAKTKTTG